MKYVKVLCCFVLFFGFINLLAKERLEIKVFGGPNFSSTSMGDFTSSSQITYIEKDTIKKNGVLQKRSAEIGYVLGIQGQMDLSDKIQFYAGLEFNRFNSNDLTVFKENSTETYTNLNVITSIIPISAGINFYLYKSDLGVFAIGDMSYNFISYSLKYPISAINLDMSTTLKETRVGIGAGFGLDYQLDKVLVSAELKYRAFNFIGKLEDEQDKKTIQLKLGVIF